ncbi:MAG: Demethylrebeccamycin-D-glucose O-methyltransferase [candidate division WS2 bacterium]|nr:Demethylrebeccamycin-D-glucose O-methyltransferase [Candidatus Psychracetigena formicireducens]
MEENKLDDYILKRELKSLPNKGLILDIGCGGGRIMDYLSNFLKSKVIGIDIDYSLLKGKKDVICSDTQLLPFKNNVFDAITGVEVLEHVPNPGMCIKELYRVLKGGGTLILTTPIFNLPHFLISIGRPVFLKVTGGTDNVPYPHLNFFSIKDHIDMLSLHNFKIIKIRYSGFTVIFNSRLKKGKLKNFINYLDIALSNLDSKVCNRFAFGITIVSEKRGEERKKGEWDE